MIKIANYFIYFPLFLVACLPETEKLPYIQRHSSRFLNNMGIGRIQDDLSSELKTLNTVEHLLMAEHFLRTATRLLEFQRNEKNEENQNKYLNGMVNKVEGSPWVERFAKWNNQSVVNRKGLLLPSNKCFYDNDSWTNQMDGIVYAEYIIPECVKASFLCEHCFTHFRIDEAISTFMQFKPLKKCSCQKFKNSSNAISELMQNKGKKVHCKMKITKVENTIKNVLDYFKRNLLKIIEEYKPQIEEKSEKNAMDFDVLLAFLFKIAVSNLSGEYPKESKIMKLKKWFQNEFERLTGMNEFCQNVNDNDIEKCDWREMIRAIRRKNMADDEMERTILDNFELDEEEGNKWKIINDENDNEFGSTTIIEGEEKSKEMKSAENRKSNSEGFNFSQIAEKVSKKINKNAVIRKFRQRTPKNRYNIIIDNKINFYSKLKQN